MADGDIKLKQLDQSGATTGQHPEWNGSAWVPATPGAGLATKAGTVLSGAFSGSPKKATVTFATAFADANYAVVVQHVSTSSATWSPTIESKAAGSFVINMASSSVSNLTAVCWIAVKHGET